MSESTKTIGIYSESNTGKTSNLLHFCKWYYSKYRKKIRYCYCDSGANHVADSGLVELGVVDVFDITGRQDRAKSTLRMLSEGYWYRTITATGEKVMRKENVFLTTQNEWKDIGVMMFEGGTKIATMMKRGISSSMQVDPQGKVQGFAKPYEYVEDGYSFGGVAMQDIGTIQTTVLDCMVRMKRNLPVDYMIWTFHVGMGQVRKTDETVICPQIEGNAVNALVGTDLMELLHLCREDVQVQETDGTVAVENLIMMYFKDHPDQTTGLTCKTKCRLGPNSIAELEKKWPYGGMAITRERGIVDYLDYVETLQEKEKRNSKVWFDNLNDNGESSITIMEELKQVVPIKRFIPIETKEESKVIETNLGRSTENGASTTKLDDDLSSLLAGL